MKVVLKCIPGYLIFLFCLTILAQGSASPFPQKDEKETTSSTVEEDDIYEEEEGTTVGSSTVAGEEEDEEEYEDEDEYDKKRRQDAENYVKAALIRRAAGVKLATHLGLPDWGRQSLVDKVSEGVIKYLRDQGAQLPYRESLKPTTTTKPPTIISSPVQEVTKNDETSQVRTFLITVPNGLNGSERTIEINIPMEMTMMRNQTSESGGDLVSSSDDLSVKYIEAAVMEALLIAETRAVMTAISGMTPLMNETDIFEMGFNSTELFENITKSAETKAVDEFGNFTIESTSLSPQQEVAPFYIDIDSQPLQVNPPTTRPTRRRRVRSTTERPNTDDSPQISKLPQFLWNNIKKFANNMHVKAAVGTVECQLFSFCPDDGDEKEDTELGLFEKYATF